MNKNNYAIIMAGGVGRRFWPLSKQEHPIQFLDVLDTGKTLIQQIYALMKQVCPIENIFIITNNLYRSEVKKQLTGIPVGNILNEPEQKNTAPCISYGVFKIKKLNPKANILIMPSDQIIFKEDLFLNIVLEGLNYVANHDVLLTFGVKPHKPATDYSYLKSKGRAIHQSKNKWKLKLASDFIEKPDLKTAKKLVNNKGYFWYTGIFTGTVYSILDAFKKHLPDLYGNFHDHIESINTEKEQTAIEAIYDVCESISFNTGIMQKTENIYLMSADIGWLDLSSWSVLQDISDTDAFGNASNNKKALFYNSKNCLVRIPDDKVAIIDGLEDCVVVEDKKALLICKKQDEQPIKQFVKDVKIHFGKQYV